MRKKCYFVFLLVLILLLSACSLPVMNETDDPEKNRFENQNDEENKVQNNNQDDNQSNKKDPIQDVSNLIKEDTKETMTVQVQNIELPAESEKEGWLVQKSPIAVDADGKIYYSSNEAPESGGHLVCNAALWVYDPETRTSELINNDPGFSYYLSVRVNDDFIVWIRKEKESGNEQVCLYDTESKEMQQIGQGKEISSNWFMLRDDYLIWEIKDAHNQGPIEATNLKTMEPVVLPEDLTNYDFTVNGSELIYYLKGKDTNDKLIIYDLEKEKTKEEFELPHKVFTMQALVASDEYIWWDSNIDNTKGYYLFFDREKKVLSMIGNSPLPNIHHPWGLIGNTLLATERREGKLILFNLDDLTYSTHKTTEDAWEQTMISIVGGSEETGFVLNYGSKLYILQESE